MYSVSVAGSGETSQFECDIDYLQNFHLVWKYYAKIHNLY